MTYGFSCRTASNWTIPLQAAIEPPSDFESALAVALNVLLHANKEVSRTQTCSYFNVFLAPYAKGVEAARLKENLRLFILNLNQHAQVDIGA